MSLNTVYFGAVHSPVREFMADIVKAGAYKHALVPTAGSFADSAALVARGGIAREQLSASDISLFTSLVGYLADPRHSLDELAIQTDDPVLAPWFATDDVMDRAAGILLAFRYATIRPLNPLLVNTRREIAHNWTKYRGDVRASLERLLPLIKGIRYDIRDLREVIAEWEGGADEVLVFGPPWWTEEYPKVYGPAESKLQWAGLVGRSLEPEEVPDILAALYDKPGLVLINARDPETIPEGWEMLLSRQIGRSLNYEQQTLGDREYVFANRPVGRRVAVAPPPVVKHDWTDVPLYLGQEITADSDLRVVSMGYDTVLHYRDLFVHRLGNVGAFATYGLLIDGRLFAVLGLGRDGIMQYKTDYVVEMFGATITNATYVRLSKLTQLAITSGDMKRYLMANERCYHLREPKGLQTTDFIRGETSMTDRGIMKQVRKERMKTGTWKIVYRADFRDDTWADCVRYWLKRWGKKKGDHGGAPAVTQPAA